MMNDKEAVKSRVLEELLEKDNLDRLFRIMEKLDVIEVALEKLAWMKENGILDDLVNMMGEIVVLQRGLVNEEMVKLIAEATATITPYLKSECIEGARWAYSSSERLGIVGLLRKLRDPDVQRGLAVTLGILKAIGQCAGTRSAKA